MTRPTLSYNEAAFHTILRDYVDTSCRAVRDTYNSRMLDLLIKAYRATPKADKGKIRADLTREVPIGRGGRIQFAAVLVNWKRKQAGEQPLAGAELSSKARALIGARARAAGFVRSGYVPALRIFNAAKRASRGLPGLARPQYGREPKGLPKGDGTPASGLIRPAATASNTAVGVEKVGVAALAQAFAESAAGMRRVLERNLETYTRRFNGRQV